MRLVLASRRNATLYAHWVTASLRKAMPTSKDIGPATLSPELVPDLPYIYIARVMRDELGTWFKFRLMGSDLGDRLHQDGSLMGSDLGDRLHQDGTGRMLLDLQIGGWEEEWRRNLVQTVQMKLPVVDESIIKTEPGYDLDIEHLALPISEDGLVVDQIFGSIDFIGQTEVDLQKMIPQLDWKKITSVELAKRIIISNLRLQV